MTIKTILACVILSIFSTPEIICKKTKNTEQKAAKPVNPCPGKLVKNMDEAELEATLTYAKEIKDSELALKTFFYLISQSKSQEIIKKYKIDYADYVFELEDYEKSLLAYEEFSMLYPGSQEAEYAAYKAILSTFLLSLDFDKDQTLTNRTVSMCLVFLQTAKNEKFITEAKTMHNTCRKRLFDHEVYVLETYLKLVKMSSAAKRIEYIEKEFSDIAHLHEYVIYFKEMAEIVKNRKTRPFIIKLNLKEALGQKTERVEKSKARKTASFFLS
jgi:outer membrane assembly lipoprotein YfiO